MKYWGFLAAKLAVAGGVSWVVLFLLLQFLPKQGPGLRGVTTEPFTHDLSYTTAMLVYFLFVIGLVYLAILDQRYRCRTCLRRLRMPIAQGSWTHVLLGPPRTDYICTYGHGTLEVPDLQLGGPHPPAWQKHEDDIWKELVRVEDTKK